MQPNIHPEINVTGIEYQLRQLRINEHRQKRTRHLSGGTQRKLNVAIALINAPEVCVLDEPSTGTDVMQESTVYVFLNSAFHI